MSTTPKSSIKNVQPLTPEKQTAGKVLQIGQAAPQSTGIGLPTGSVFSATKADALMLEHYSYLFIGLS